MRFEFALARRYLRSPGQSLAKITSRLAVVGIALGVAALIFSQSLARGFREEVQEKLLSNTAHITVSRTDGGGIENWRELKDELKDELKIGGIAKIAAASYQSSLLITEKVNAYAMLRGREEMPPEHNAERKDGCVAVSVGGELAARAGLKSGDTADVIFGLNDSEPPKKKCLSVKNTFSTGLYEYDSTLIDLSLDDLVRMSGVPPTSLEIKVTDIYRSKLIAEKIKEKLGTDYKTLDWQEANKPFFAAISFERQMVLIIISLVILLSALNITFTLALGVTQRRQDIAILRTAGAKTRKIVLTFLLEGLLLGAAGIFCGVVLGLSACFLANYFNLISLPREVYVLSKITLRPDPVEILIIVLAGFVLTFLATAYPAFSAAKVKPWENLARS